MAGFTLQMHMVFDWCGIEYTVYDLHDSGQVVLENTKNGVLEVITKQSLLSEYKAGKISARPGNLLPYVVAPVFARPLDELSQSDVSEIQRRKHYLDGISASGNPVFTKDFVNPLIKKIAIDIGDSHPPSSTTVYRWYRLFRATNDTRSLLKRFDLRGPKHVRQSELVLNIIAEAIEQEYKDKPLATVEDIFTTMWGKITEQNRKRLPKDQIKIPSKRTLHRIVKKADIYEITKLKEGKASADRRLRVVMQGVKTKYILERVEIDHTPLDLFLIDEKTWLPLGRPTLTVALDHFSRMPVGYYLTFDSPCTAGVIGTLRHAILPKDPVNEVVPNRKVNHHWPCYGTPKLIAVDNGLEFYSQDLESVAFDLGITILYCPKKQPWYKGSIERYLKTINYTLVSQFPGASFSKFYLRGDYDPLKCAILTMAEFKHAFEKWILDIYSQSKHSSINVTPWSRWQDSAIKQPLVLPEDKHTLERRIGLVEERTLQNNGILLNNIQYNGHVIAPLLDKYGPGIKVRLVYNPEDLGEVQVWGPEQPDPITVPALELEYAKGLTLKQNEMLRKQILERGAATVDKEALMQAKYDLKLLIKDLMGSRNLKHRKQGAALAGITSSQTKGSAIVSEADQKTKSSKQPKSLNKMDAKDSGEMPPPLATFQMQRKPRG